MIRAARPADAEAIRAIYAPFVEDTAVSFEDAVPSTEEMAERIASSRAWLVAEEEGTVAGYAYAAPLRPRAAYRWSVEVSVYLAPRARGRGVGRRLVAALLDHLRARGFVNAFAGTTIPNPASVGLFESLGFEQIGQERRVGFKRGKWHDVGWWQLRLQEPRDDFPPPEPS